MKKWFGTNWTAKLGGELGGVFATENSPNGGAELALITMAGHILVKGMLVYSGRGRPFIYRSDSRRGPNNTERRDMQDIRPADRAESA